MMQVTTLKACLTECLYLYLGNLFFACRGGSCKHLNGRQHLSDVEVCVRVRARACVLRRWEGLLFIPALGKTYPFTIPVGH